jgi:short-chain 2-methylacyl-CoA dehydrogenase
LQAKSPQGYDPPRVNLDLTDEQREIQRLARDFATAEVMPVAEELDRDKRFPIEIVGKLGELGLMGVPYPTELGGGGADTLSYALVVEELGRADQSVGITVAAHTSLGTWPIYAFGSDAQRAEWLPELCSGRRLGAFGLTEPEAGSDAAAARTTARRENGGWTIDGAKQFITNAGTEISGCVTITARTGEDEISNLIVANGTPGYEIAEPYRKMGWNASDTRPLAFDGCHVGEDALLGERGAGFRQFLQTLDGGRISVSALALGCAQRCLDEALAYARERRAFGQPVSRFQTIQAKLADLSTELEAARLLTYKAALEKDAGKTFSLAAAQAKLKTGRLAVRAAEEAVQIHGGYGYIEEYPVCRFYRDAKILTIGEGTDEIQQMVIARGLGA